MSMTKHYQSGTFLPNCAATAAAPLIAVLAAMLLALPARAQMRRIVAYSTDHTLALTEADAESAFEADIVEAYDFECVDEPPAFPGGYGAMMQFINSMRKYPVDAYTRGVQGRVLCSFIVQPDGEVTHVNVIRGIMPSLNREAVRILDHMPRWQAGRMAGTAVPVYCMFPITFRL